MNLCIMSQNKKILGNFNDICVKLHREGKYEEDYRKGIYEIIGYFDKNTEFEILGIYETEERALEVIDDIKETIAVKEMLHFCYKDTIEVIKSTYKSDNGLKILIKCALYEMPKE